MRNHISIIFTALVLFATAALAQVAEPTAVAVPETTDALGDTIAVDPSPLYAEAEFDDIVELDGITIDPRERPMEPMAPEGLEIGKAGEYSYFSSDAVGIGTGAVEPGVQLEIYSPTGTGTVDMLRLRSKHDTGPNVYSLYFSPREVSYVIENGATGTNLTLSTKAVSGGSFQAGYGNILLMPHGNVGVANASPAYPLDVTGTARVTGFIMPTGASANRVLTSNASGVGTWEELPSMPADNVTGSGTANYVAKFTSTGSVIGNSSIYDNGTNVGIGTASPAEKLHVIGNIQSSNGALIGTQFISNSIYSAADGILITTDIAISNNRMIELYIEGNSYDSWGAIGGKVQAYNYVTSGTIISTSYVTHGISPSEVRIFHHDGVVKFWMEQTRTYQTYRFRLSTHSGSHKITSIQNTAMPSTGVTNEVILTPKTVINNNVGIGLSNPSRPLDVNGAGRIRGDLGVDNNLGVTGQTSTGTFLMTTGASTGHVLTSDASGYGTWQALPTLPSDNVTGTGTANYVAKFTSTGSVIGNSSIFDDGTNVGIGTASPLEKIHINGDVLMKSNTGTRTLTITMEAVTAGNVNLDLKPNSTSDQLAHIKSTYGFQFETNTSGTAVDALRITPAGNVGIGTPSPVDKLDVYGGGITVSDGTDAGFIDFRHDRDDSRIYESSYNLHMISANGLTFDYDANGNDGGDFIINDNGTARFFVERVTGDIGIHTTAPTTDLDVNGTTRLRGHLYDYGNSSGSSGQILTRGASGVLWSDGDGDFIQNQSSSDQDAWFQIDKTLPNDGDAVAEINFAKASVTTNTAYGVKITSDALDGKGVMCGLSASTEINPVSHSQDGKASAILANVRGYDLRGEIIGVWGISNPTRLSQIGGTSWANGVKGVVSPDGGTLTLDSGDETWVAGAYGEIKGTINNTPGAGAVAGIIGIDNAIGTATSYAGYFDGDVHITGNLTGGGLSSSNWTLSGTDLYPSSTTYDVGIGTTSPGYKLDVNGVIRNNNNIYFGSNTPGGSDELSTDFNDGIIVYTPVSGDRLVSIEVDNDDILTATQSGNVGIGLTNPSAKLVVNQGDNILLRLENDDNGEEAGVRFRSRTTGGSYLHTDIACDADGGYMEFRVPHDQTRMVVNSSGNVGIGTTSPLAKLHAYESGTSSGSVGVMAIQGTNISSTGIIAGLFARGSDYGIYQYASARNALWAPTAIGAADPGTAMLYVDGNVGIGTTSPTYTLDVAGSAGFNDYIYHNDDTDTRLLFETDRLRAYIGAQYLLDLYEGTQDYVKLGDGGDVDINLNDDLFVEGSSSNVGVGTTSPDAKLHSVSSYSGTGSALTNASIAGVNDNDDSDNPDGIGVYGECSTDYGYAGYFNGDLRVTGKYLDSSGDAGISGQILSSTGSGTNWIAAPSGGSLPSGSSGQTLRHNGTSWIANSTLYNNGTNVGIGTTGPSTNFEVYESSTSTTPMIEVQQASTGDAAMRFIAGNTYTIGVDNSDGDKFKISDYTLLSSNTRLTIDASGNVGIGTTSPASELSVGGSGNALYEVYSYQPTTTTSGAAAIYGDCALPAVNSAGHYAYGVYGHSESDNGHAVGVCGAATGGDALGGRGIGVRGTASGSTNGYNHGVYGYLSSGVGGSAVVGYDYNGCTSWSGGVSTAYDYAGYFVGQVNIYQSRSATSQLTGLNVTLSNSSSSADAMYGVDISSSKSYDSGSNYGLDVYVNNGRFVYGVNSNANGGSSYTYGVYGRGSTYGVYASGSLGASGTKSAIVRTEEGPKAVYCQESPENWFEDFGKAKIAGGKAVVGVAKDFLMTVTINDEYPMNVFITPNARLGEWWVEEKHDEFVLHAPDAPDGAGFSYRIVAKRKGYEDIRLLDAPSSWIDHFLYPNIEDVPQEYREEWINVEPTQNWDQWLEYLSENQKAHYQNYKEDEKREELSRKEFEAENSAKSE